MPNNAYEFWYMPITGRFISRTANGAWKPAGTISKALGYVTIGSKYAHRLAFQFMTGRPPVGQVDHINGDRADNRWCNLRDVSQHINLLNSHKAKANNKLGVRGVRMMKGKFQTRINRDGVCHHLGTFDTLDEAKAVYERAKKSLHPEAFC